jgi:hypothetical protein
MTFAHIFTKLADHVVIPSIAFADFTMKVLDCFFLQQLGN